VKRSDQTNEISKALASAQAEIRNPGFDSTNPHFRNKFASLAAIRNAVVPVFAKHGLSVMQELTTEGNGVACLTIVQHESGQWLEFGPLVMPANKPDAQGLGSAATYCRRYALQSVAAIVGDEDEDGNEASKGFDAALAEKIAACQSLDELAALFKSLPESARAVASAAFSAKKKALQ
jgi:hypothetical protein